MAHEYVIGCDNAAVDLKNTIREMLAAGGHPVEDVGCFSAQDTESYPRVAKKVCERIIGSGYAKRGILLCGTGIGMAIAANKFRGIRAGVCHDTYSAERLALSNNGSVLCLGARVVGPELAKKVVREWTRLEYRDGPSNAKIEDIQDIEHATMK